jgi:phosphoribosylaminoimidazolecarboxamide formyltransferase/IMP cyclohydrolase
MIDLWPIRTALLSVTDKTGLESLARGLHQRGVHIISTGGTGKMLKEWSIPFQDITEFTGHPEAFSGRMKTISFACASGLLFRRQDPSDELEAAQLGIKAIDLVVCNLYPFEKVAAEKADEPVLVENIDIGGPLMIRAAAKNFASVSVLTDPAQYESFLASLVSFQGQTTFALRRELAARAFERIAQYDVAIAQTLGERILGDKQETRFIALTNAQPLRYGENPHQKATVYEWKNSQGATIKSARILQGKELSSNNMLDADAAWKAASDVQNLMGKGCAAIVVKHGNPCGMVHASSTKVALERAWAGDSVSAFGGIIALTQKVDAEIATFFNEKFIEILMAPEFTPEAMQILATKKNVRVLELPVLSADKKEMTLRSFCGGVLYQEEDEKLSTELKTVTKVSMTSADKQTSLFGVLCAKHLKSNAIALVRTENGVTELVGAGMGQPNRLDSFLRLALPRMVEKDIKPESVIMVSDAFFPFGDTVEVAAKAGIKRIVQPGGSIRDDEVFAMADKYNVAMVCTGERHFRH